MHEFLIGPSRFSISTRGGIAVGATLGGQLQTGNDISTILGFQKCLDLPKTQYND